jgi:peptidoglycan/LPS O-acetylase OafA/YrhL
MQQDGDRIGALDGLRALAILLVVLRHLPKGDVNQGLRSLFFKIAEAGWVGVDLFFVLSGFLITGILIRARGEPHALRNFYMRRTLRIFPLHYLGLAVAFFLLPPLFGCEGIPARLQLPYWGYVANFRTMDVESPCVHVGHFWSLAIEEQFYAFWPLLVLLAPPRWGKRASVAIIALALATRGVLVAAEADWRPFFWTFARADALACGALVAFLRAEGKQLARWSVPLAAVSGAMVAVLAWRNRLDTAFLAGRDPVTLAERVVVPLVLALFFAALLVLALERRPLARLLDLAPFRFLAKYSYGIYVWHLLVIGVLLPRLAHWPVLAAALVAALASLAAAVASYHLFEAPFLRLKRYFPQRGHGLKPQ